MNKITHKLALLLFSTILMTVISAVPTAFAAEKSMSITFRIEGIEKNLLYETVDVPFTDSLTLQKALTYIDSKEDGITITGLENSYITAVNGEAAGKFGGWDGWLYKVNGKDPSVGIDSLELSDGDSITLYYGDPYGVGMQFPAADTQDLKKGVIKFTSKDTTYDADGNAIVKKNSITGATVTWNNGDTTTEYVTDKNGSVTINADQLTTGTHSIQISKTGASKLPLVLRFAPDYTINVTEGTSDTSASDKAAVNTGDSKAAVTADNSPEVKADTSASDKADTSSEVTVNATAANTSDKDKSAANTAINTASNTDNSAPKTGENRNSTILYIVFAMISLGGVITLKRKDCNEK